MTSTIFSAVLPHGRMLPDVVVVVVHESKKLGAYIKAHAGWELKIVKRKEREFAIVGLNWIVERTFPWLGRERRLSKDYEEKVHSSEAMIAIAACRLLMKRLAA